VSTRSDKVLDLGPGSGETTSLLLEIGCEEIPARFLEGAERDLGAHLSAALGFLKASSGEVKTYSTPRRLVAHVPKLYAKQPGRVEELMGPSVKIAYDKEGKPTRAAESFAAKNNVTLEDLSRLTTPKGEYLAVRKVEPGRPALAVLAEMLPGAIAGIAFPKNMYWIAKSGPRFIRPIRWILALLGEGDAAQVVQFSFAGVQSGRSTYGHRLKGGKAIPVHDFKYYLNKLREHCVEVDQAQRRRFAAATDELLKAKGVVRVADEALESWVVNSTEWPEPLMGSFDERYLKLPREVLITVMRDHQKYFAVEDKGGNLQPQFVTVLNVPGDPQGLIRQGHERVLAARFADAEFFWNADQRVPLVDRIPMLARVTYQAKLGTYADKIRRMRSLAEKVCAELEMSGSMNAQEQRYVLRAVDLCKCDLTTKMVQEFTELQGIMGGLYAKSQGEPSEVADAIYDHYRPVGIEDSCPRSVAGAVVSLADKLDSVVSGFRVGLEPTGSSDPFGLRRAGNGIIRLAVEVLAGLDLTILTNRSLHHQQAATGAHAVVSSESGELGHKIDGFLRERMEFYVREAAGLRYDTVRAVLKRTKILQDLVPSNALSRARALERVRDTEDFQALAAAAKRTRNIRKSANEWEIVSGRPDPALFTEAPERELYEAYRSLWQRIESLSEEGNYEEAFQVMGTIRPQVDSFFDKVLVMTDDAAVRSNRLLLLLRLNEDVFTSLADLAEIVVEPRSRTAGG